MTEKSPLILKNIVNHLIQFVSNFTFMGPLESSQRLRDMKYIGIKHQRENKQNSDNA
jgi:hypothetical protein